MKEHAFNLFAFINADYIRELGVVAHEVSGSDSEKLVFLQKQAANDSKVSCHYPIPDRYSVIEDSGEHTPGIHYRAFEQMTRGGRVLDLYEEILEELGAGTSPIVCITCVVDSSIRIDEFAKLPELCSSFSKVIVNRYQMPDYLRVYLTQEGFDLSRLFNDDYFRAIKLLFKNRLFVSAAKLLMSFIDTMAYLQEGDLPGNFQRWLSSYVDLSSLDVTSDELWEFRNSVLHMTNVDSRKVSAKKVRRLTFFVGNIPDGFVLQNGEAKYFNLQNLIYSVIEGLEKWTDEFNREPAKIRELIERYDRILSDVRYEVYEHSPLKAN